MSFKVKQFRIAAAEQVCLQHSAYGDDDDTDCVHSDIYVSSLALGYNYVQLPTGTAGDSVAEWLACWTQALKDHDSRHQQADCQEPESAPEPYAL